MRVLHVQAAGDDSVVLHPRITIVAGRSQAARSALVEGFAGLVGEQPSAMGGLVDVQGMLLDLSEETRRLLDLDAATVRPVVAAVDVPGHDSELLSARTEREALTSARAEAVARLDVQRAALGDAVLRRDRIQAELEEIERGEGAARELLAAAGAERSRLEFELEVARDERARHETQLSEALLGRDALRNARDKTRIRYGTARTRRQATMLAAAAAAAALEEVRSEVPPPEGASERLEAARLRMTEAERFARSIDPAGEQSGLARQMVAMHERWGQLIQRGAALGEAEARDAVVEALEVVVGDPGEGRPIVQALALADTWRDLHQQIGALDAGLTDEENAAEERVRRARRSLQEIETRVNQPALTPEQVARVEAAHQALLDAMDRSEVRIGRKRSARRVEHMRMEEKHVLGRLGFSTYAEYMISTSNRGADVRGAKAVEAARAELAAAQADLDAIPGANDRGRRRVELLARKAEVAPRIAALLGYEPTGPESENELRNLREEVVCDDGDLAALAAALEAADVVVGEGPWTRDDLVLLARSYLSEDQHVADERAEIADAIDALEGTIAELRVKRGLGHTERFHLLSLPHLARVEPESTTDAARAWDEVESARIDLKDAESAAVRRRDYENRLEARTAAWEEAVAADDEAAFALAEAELDLRPEELDRLTSATDLVEMAEAALARSRLAEADVARRITERSRDRALHDLAGAVADRLLEAEDELSSAAAAEQATASEVARAEADLERVAAVILEREAAVEHVDRAVLVNDVDWALLSRLAELRSVGLAGALPLVLDDPFGMLDDDEVASVLDGLARMAQASQVVIFTERSAVVTWAASRSEDEVSVA